MRLLICVVSVVAFLLPAPEAEACSCGRSGVEAWPKAGTPAPTDAHIFVRFPGGKKEKVILRLAGTMDTDGVPAARVDILAKDVRFVQLAPTITLASGASFEVVVGRGDKARVISTFVIAKKADRPIPKMDPVENVEFHYEEAVCCNCSSGKPYVRLEMKGKKEKANRSLYGIWTGTPGDKIDWNRKPDAYVRSWYGFVNLGDPSACSPNNYPIAKSGKMTFGVREVSHNGQLGKGQTITVKVKTKPTKPTLSSP